jgi:hypothetical protein
MRFGKPRRADARRSCERAIVHHECRLFSADAAPWNKSGWRNPAVVNVSNSHAWLVRASSLGMDKRSAPSGGDAVFTRGWCEQMSIAVPPDGTRGWCEISVNSCTSRGRPRSQCLLVAGARKQISVNSCTSRGRPRSVYSWLVRGSRYLSIAVPPGAAHGRSVYSWLVRGSRPYFFIFLYNVTRLIPSSWAARVRLKPCCERARKMMVRSSNSRL